MNWQEIKKLVDDYKQEKIMELKQKFNIKENDLVKVNDEKIVKRIKYFYFDEDEGYAYAYAEEIDACGWVCHNHSLVITDTVTKVENPVSKKIVQEILDAINNLEDNKDITRKEYDKLKEELEDKLYKLQNKCLHNYDRISEAGEGKAIGGPYTKYLWRCNICQKELIK